MLIYKKAFFICKMSYTPDFLGWWGFRSDAQAPFWYARHEHYLIGGSPE